MAHGQVGAIPQTVATGVPMTLHASDFDYPLDAERIAQMPADRRDESRLMILGRRQGKTRHAGFADLPELLRPDDLLVLNDTRVVPARFECRRKTGGRIEGLFLREPQPGRWEVLLKSAARCKAGEVLSLTGAEGLRVRLLGRIGRGRWELHLETDQTQVPSAGDVLDAAGRTPLPPYIRRPPGGPGAEDPADRERYQTVYAATPGAVAAPTAGLHFTEELLARLRRRGVEFARLTLHVGPGTFAPVKAENLSAHRMHSEWYHLPAATAAALNQARREGRRIVSVGTTSLRVLETLAKEELPFKEARGRTDLFLYPPADFRAAAALITNFHLPRSTLVMLVAAFCSPGRTDGLDTILHAYAEAARLRYRFYSYGDAMLIE